LLFRHPCCGILKFEEPFLFQIGFRTCDEQQMPILHRAFSDRFRNHKW
jgi:hypothetical protein